MAVAGAVCAAFLLSACGGGGDDGASAWSTDAAAATAGTLLDDDGGVMPADPSAVPVDAALAGLGRRYATAAQARDLQRALGAAVRRIEVGCCGDTAVAQAIAAGLANDSGPRHAVLVSGSDVRLGDAVVASLLAAGLDRVWWVSP